MSDLIGKTKLSRLEQRALHAGWAIPPEDKRKIVERQVKIAANAASNRQATSAARALLSMNAQDQRQVKEDPVDQPQADLQISTEALSAAIQSRMDEERDAKLLMPPDRNGPT